DFHVTGVQTCALPIWLKLPDGHGIWPAVWMLGTNINEVGWPASGEIDNMEYVGREPHTIYSSLHTPANHAGNASSKKTVIKDIRSEERRVGKEWRMRQ